MIKVCKNCGVGEFILRKEGGVICPQCGEWISSYTETNFDSGGISVWGMRALFRS